MKEQRLRDMGATTGDETILLVDDEEAILDVNREILQALGYTVMLARNGNEAVDVYQNHPGAIDLVLLDMIMPGMSGEETYTMLKTLNPEIKVILLSGYSIDGQAKKILESGCHAFIQKPFKIATLSGKIREILDKECN